MDIDLQLDNNSSIGDDRGENATLFPPSPASTSVFVSSTSTSTSAASGSKRKFSALDDDNISVVSGSSKKRSGAEAMIEVSVGVVAVSSSIRDLTAERRLYRLHKEARGEAQDAQEAQAAQQALPPSPARRSAALQRLQQLDSDLGPAPMVKIANLIAKDTVAADTYMSWGRDDFRKAWIVQALEDMDKAAVGVGM